MNRTVLLRTAMVAAIGLAGVLAVGLVLRALWVDPRAGGGRDATATGAALIGGPFELTDQDGRRVSDGQFRGKLMLVYFGYAFCPDVCPTTLLDISRAMELLGPAAEHVQPLFVTVDPERDTPDALKAFLANFDPRIRGLTGTPAEIQAAAKAYRVYYARAKGSSERDYLMDHLSIVYLMDRRGKYLTHFTMKDHGEEMAAAIKKFL
jgi:protein SCO1/2